MHSDWKAGQIFDGKFELLSELGSGGIGKVFEAKQLLSGRLVALKIFRHRPTQPEHFLPTFQREGHLHSQIVHPGVVQILSSGFSTDGTPYIVMELAKGQSLRKLINDSGRFPARQALGIAIQVAKTMDFVHNSNIIHRDLKPENIVLCETQSMNTIKILDFGLAKSTEPEEVSLTQSGLLAGTSNYMSPEQCAGKKAGPASDVYSLTVILYEMLTGKRPYDADTPVGVMYKHMNDQVPSIKKEQLDCFHPNLDKIISNGMAKIPEQRCNMAELAALMSKTEKLLQPSSIHFRFPLKYALFMLPIAGAVALLFSARPAGLDSILAKPPEQASKILIAEFESKLKEKGSNSAAQKLYAELVQSGTFKHWPAAEHSSLLYELFHLWKEKKESAALRIAQDLMFALLTQLRTERQAKITLDSRINPRMDEICDYLQANANKISQKEWKSISAALWERSRVPGASGKNSTEELISSLEKNRILDLRIMAMQRQSASLKPEEAIILRDELIDVAGQKLSVNRLDDCYKRTLEYKEVAEKNGLSVDKILLHSCLGIYFTRKNLLSDAAGEMRLLNGLNTADASENTKLKLEQFKTEFAAKTAGQKFRY